MNGRKAALRRHSALAAARPHDLLGGSGADGLLPGGARRSLALFAPDQLAALVSVPLTIFSHKTRPSPNRFADDCTSEHVDRHCRPETSLLRSVNRHFAHILQGG